MERATEAEETAGWDLGPLLDAGECAVVTLAAGEARVAAHRAVLAARSPVFAALVHQDTLEVSGGHIDLTDVEGPVLRQLVSYCYTLRAPQRPSVAPQLLAAAKKYGVSGLKVECERTLESSSMGRVPEAEEMAGLELGPLLDAGECAMVTLAAGEARLAAHRAVLAARSPVFAAMVHQDTLEVSGGHITLTDVEGPALRQLVSYCYTLRAPQRPSVVPQLLAAADKYDISGLKAVCEQQLGAQLSVETAAATAVLAVRHSCPSLTAAALAFIKANHKVLATQGWSDAVLHQPDDAVEELVCRRESQKVDSSSSGGYSGGAAGTAGCGGGCGGEGQECVEAHCSALCSCQRTCGGGEVPVGGWSRGGLQRHMAGDTSAQGCIQWPYSCGAVARGVQC
ncbi:uncharacterized protein LOC126094674 isoform X2 [Schistocerca cancellata]|uniref:uncharacterized protein LOC126094674 isoform X2 n=1 Tax=Schistocerca cancellata TaxID=274614 RepID=UPI002118DB33|nr:uncharacterized protein LOC126094674 isoform X2 [Schistocerca cancellata]